MRLAAGVTLDFETNPALNVRFNALFIGDNGTMTIDQSEPSEISVTDVNEGITFEPVSPIVDVAAPRQGGTVLGTYSAVDGDGDLNA